MICIKIVIILFVNLIVLFMFVYCYLYFKNFSNLVLCEMKSVFMICICICFEDNKVLFFLLIFFLRKMIKRYI